MCLARDDEWLKTNVLRQKKVRMLTVHLLLRENCQPLGGVKGSAEALKTDLPVGAKPATLTQRRTYRCILKAKKPAPNVLRILATIDEVVDAQYLSNSCGNHFGL